MKIIEKKEINVENEIPNTGIGRVMRLPVSARKMHGMTTVCDACGHPVEDAYFIGAIMLKGKNYIFHESCAKQNGIEYKVVS